MFASPPVWVFSRFSGFLPSPKNQATMLEVEVVLEDMVEVVVVI